MNSELKKLRIGKGYTLEQLSELTGISTKYLSSLEEGKEKNPTISTIEKIAVALKMDFVAIYYIIKYMIKNRKI